MRRTQDITKYKKEGYVSDHTHKMQLIFHKFLFFSVRFKVCVWSIIFVSFPGDFILQCNLCHKEISCIMSCDPSMFPCGVYYKNWVNQTSGGWRSQNQSFCDHHIYEPKTLPRTRFWPSHVLQNRTLECIFTLKITTHCNARKTQNASSWSPN